MCSTSTQLYFLDFYVNGKRFKKRTSDLQKTFASLETPITEMFVTVKKGDRTSERKLTLVQARKLINDEDYRGIFINNLLLI